MLGATLDVKNYMDRVFREIQRLDPAQIQNMSALIERAYVDGRFVLQG